MKWTPDKLALLGTMPDTRLAVRLGIERAAVAMQRLRKKIPAYCARGRPQREQTQT